jgi:hypothetical protein
VDTREKILTVGVAAETLAGDGWVALTGQFDPLTAEQARRVTEAGKDGRKVLAVVLRGSEDGSLLSAEARAQLMAGLRAVAAVVVCTEAEWQALRSRVGAKTIIKEDSSGEAARSARFAEFVRERQGAAGVGR